MRALFGVLLASAFVFAGAEGVAAQQPGTMRADSTQHARHTTTTHRRHHKTKRTTTHHARRHAMSHERRHTRMSHARREASERMASTRPQPMVLGRDIGPSGISSSGRIQRLANGLITPDAARTIALRNVPGGTRVDKIDLQSEDGRQVYDVKVITPGQTGNEKVRVDATTGQVIEIKNVDNPVGTVTNGVKGAVNKVTGHH